MKDYQIRNRFFYVTPNLFSKWDYPSRYAIGVNLKDADYRNAPYFKFQVKGKMYKIARDKGIELGTKYTLKFGIMPNLIPLEEFEEVTS